MAQGWDAAAWAAKGLPATGELCVELQREWPGWLLMFACRVAGGARVVCRAGCGLLTRRVAEWELCWCGPFRLSRVRFATV